MTLPRSRPSNPTVALAIAACAMMLAFASGSVVATGGGRAATIGEWSRAREGARPAAPRRATAPETDAPARCPATGPLRIFYCTHSAGFRHECLPLTREVFAGLGRDLDWLEVEVSDDIADLPPAKFEAIDVLVLYTSGTLPMSDDQRAALRRFVESGGGVVGVHSASDTFHDWPWFIALVGGEFDGHPWHEEVAIVVDDPDHPATAHLAPRFRILDEIYRFRRLNDERKTLMSLDTESVTHSVEPGRPYPLAWTLEPGRGRVFYTALGHRDEVWKDQRFVDHLLGGIRWAGRRDAAAPAPPLATP